MPFFDYVVCFTIGLAVTAAVIFASAVLILLVEGVLRLW